MYQIFLVEDDPGIAEAIAARAAQWDLRVTAAQDFRNILPEFLALRPHLVLLDIGLPYFNGYHWCAELRRISKVPILFLSSASDNLNMVMAMNLGADDFIAKPFDGDVLIAKMQALLNTGDGTLRFGERTLTLSRNEFRILLCLLENKGRAVSRERLMERLWQTDQFVDENTLTVNVNRLRKKLDALGLPDFIGTRFGVGYLVE